jgi:hypothetical protein
MLALLSPLSLQKRFPRTQSARVLGCSVRPSPSQAAPQRFSRARGPNDLLHTLILGLGVPMARVRQALLTLVKCWTPTRAEPRNNPYRPSARSTPASNGCKNPAQQRRLRSLAGRRQYLVRTRRSDLNPVKMINSRSKLFAADGSSINTSRARPLQARSSGISSVGSYGTPRHSRCGQPCCQLPRQVLPARSYSPLEGRLWASPPRAALPYHGRAIETCSADFYPGWHAALTAKFELLEPVAQHLGDESWLRHVCDVAMACQNVDTRTRDCRGGHGCDLCKLGRGLGSG